MEHLNSFLGEYFLGFFSEAYDKHLGFMGDLGEKEWIQSIPEIP